MITVNVDTTGLVNGTTYMLMQIDNFMNEIFGGDRRNT